MIFVGGLSGSGKTTLSERLIADRPKINLIRASAILEKLDRPLSQLTKEMAEENQRILASWLERNCELSPILFDGHGLITISEEPFIYRISIDLFRQLSPSLIVWVTATPRELLSRREWPQRLRTVEAISNLQQLEGDYLKQNAETTGASFQQLEGHDYSGFARCIEPLLKH